MATEQWRRHDRVTASVWERSPRQHCGVDSAIASGPERLANTHPIRFEAGRWAGVGSDEWATPVT